MKTILQSLATVSLAALVTGAGVTTAKAHASQIPNLTRVENTTDTVVLTETEVNKTAVKFRRNVDRNGVILKGYDPVAYVKQGKAVKGQPSLTSTYHGAIYQFASKADKADFDQSPARFEPQYGAFCAGNMAHRKLSDIDPNVFCVYQGKLYLCSHTATGKAFMAHPDVNIPKADKNWNSYEPPRSPGFHENLG